jgi:hypothetical protein
MINNINNFQRGNEPTFHMDNAPRTGAIAVKPMLKRRVISI